MVPVLVTIHRARAPASGREPLADRLDDAFSGKTGGGELDSRIALVDETVGQPDLEHLSADAVALEGLQHRASRPAGNDVLFHRYQQVVPGGELLHELLV